MQISPFNYLPLAAPFFIALAVVVVAVIALVEVRVLSYAYERIGIDRRYVFMILVGALVGSYINIPVARLPAEQVISDQVISFFGMKYVVPVVHDWPGTVIALNVGGAIIPTVLSLYLLV